MLAQPNRSHVPACWRGETHAAGSNAGPNAGEREAGYVSQDGAADAKSGAPYATPELSSLVQGVERGVYAPPLDLMAPEPLMLPLSDLSAAEAEALSTPCSRLRRVLVEGAQRALREHRRAVAEEQATHFFIGDDREEGEGKGSEVGPIDSVEGQEDISEAAVLAAAGAAGDTDSGEAYGVGKPREIEAEMDGQPAVELGLVGWRPAAATLMATPLSCTTA